jgi:hypothetical protein
MTEKPHPGDKSPTGSRAGVVDEMRVAAVPRSDGRLVRYYTWRLDQGSGAADPAKRGRPHLTVLRGR